MAPEPREQRISVGGVGVQTWIGGHGPPLLVLHGAGGNRGWRRWMQAVAQHFTLYAPTHPGFGTSDDADWMEGIDDLARFYLWFLEEVGLAKAHIFGHSIGGWTAAEMACMSPQVIDRLVLVAPVGLKPEKSEILDIFYYPPEQLFKLTVHDPATMPEYAELYGRPPSAEEREILTRNREMTARLTWKPYMYNPRLSYFLPRVKVPALVVWGRQDQIVPLECGERYQALLPRATLSVLEECGHLPPLEKPDELATRVLTFLRER